MAKVSTNISLDAETKKQAQEMLADLGLDISTAVNIFLKKMVREGKIPFVIGYETPNAETLAAIEDVENHRNLSKPYKDVDEMLHDILEEDDA